jgi:hypothetical protein
LHEATTVFPGMPSFFEYLVRRFKANEGTLGTLEMLDDLGEMNPHRNWFDADTRMDYIEKVPWAYWISLPPEKRIEMAKKSLDELRENR